MFPHTVTVWNRSDDETYTRVVIIGVLWEDKRGAQLRKTGVSPDNGIIVTIPFKNALEGFTIRPNDYIALGQIDIEPKTAKDLTNIAMRVSASDKYDFGSELSHWEVTAK